MSAPGFSFRKAALVALFFSLAAPVVSAATATVEDVKSIARLYSAADSRVVWTRSFPLKSSDDDEVAEAIASKTLEQLPTKAPRQRK